MKRIWHPWEKWECFRSGFFGPYPKGMSKRDAEEKYKEFFLDLPLFEETLKQVLAEWENSCEHNLTNLELNRIAWLGQACVAYHHKVPSDARAGFNLLNTEQQEAANKLAGKYLKLWEKKYNV